MKLKIFSNNVPICEEVAMALCSAVALNPRVNLGLATGNTQILVYKLMVQLASAMNISFKDVSTFNLDEYVEVPREGESSFFSYMKRNLFDHIDIDMANVNFPYGDKTKTIQDNILDFESEIERAGGIDIQLLGLGRNGHIGFNEPSSTRCSSTRVVRLCDETLEDNKRDFEELYQPKTAVTMGVDTILKAKKLILVATGEKKADALKRMIEGEIGEDCPASFLREHKNLIIYADKEAAKLLTESKSTVESV